MDQLVEFAGAYGPLEELPVAISVFRASDKFDKADCIIGESGKEVGAGHTAPRSGHGSNDAADTTTGRKGTM